MPATSSLQSMFPPQRRGGVVECSPGLRRRHPDHAEERRRADAALAELPPVAVARPRERLAVRPRASPVARHDLVDAHDERLPGPRAAHLDRPVERMAGAFGPLRLDVGVPEPAGVRHLERDRPAGLDRLDRLVLAGEPAPHARGSWIQASAGASRTRRPMPLPVVAAELPQRDRLLVAARAPARPRPGRSRPAGAAPRPRPRPRSGRARSRAPGRARAAGPGANASSCSASARYDAPASLTTRTRGSSHFIASPVAASRSQ